ncbi:Rrf2 family transcriptional regulator [bacterium]|nr:Rrf2 family transcriptional regulator [bacterium]
MITQTTEYALRAVVFLAISDGQAHTTAQIADGTKVPTAYLSKVLQSLSRAGLVSSQRGLGGGFTLSVDPSDLSILEIIETVDPIPRIHSCPLGLAEHGGALCSLHKQLDEALALVEIALGKSSIKDLIDAPSRVGLCTMKKKRRTTKGKKKKKLVI